MRLMLCFAAAFLALLPRPSVAQGTAQVQFIGVPSQLSAVQPTQLEQNYRAGRYPVQFIYNDPSGRPATFQFRLSVEYDGREVLVATSDPVTYRPGVYLYRTFQDAPRVRFARDLRDLFSRLDRSLQRRLNDTGRFPEGEYVVSIEAQSVGTGRLIASLPGQAVVTIRVAEPPVLIYPADGMLVTEATPQFSWSPATGLPGGTLAAYTVRIVEMRPGQTPLRAIQANIPHVETVVTGLSTFSYLPNEFPLQNGRRYAWQIVARDAGGVIDFANEGATEIYTFTYGDRGIERYVWKYPSSEDPLIEVPIPEYVRDDFERLLVSGVFAGTVKGEPVWANFGSETNAAQFRVTDSAPTPELELVGGSVRLSNGLTITAGN